MNTPLRRHDHRTVLLADAEAHRWVQVQVRRGDRVLMRLRGSTLDARLAAGTPPERDRLLAVRAATLVAPSTRQALAGYWENVLARLGERPSPASSRIPLRHDSVRLAQDDIRSLVDLLRSSPVVAARGVALAHLLLTDGTGPLYSKYAVTRLPLAVQNAITYLDPYADQPPVLAQG